MTDLDAFLADVSQRLLLSDIIRPVVRLTRRGREFSGLCPFHKEKGASFTINDEKGFYHCFGCGAHGSHLTFLMKHQGLAFKDAIAILEEKTGLILPKKSSSNQLITPEKKDAHDRVYSALEKAAVWFETQLLHHSPSQDYLKKRGIHKDTVTQFRIGYAPVNGLKEALVRQGCSLQDLIAAGLLITPENDREPYERFRNRLMFPIQDTRGRVIAFGGRVLDGGEPKYLNSPETPVFHKGRELYGLYHARSAASDHTPFMVVEGYMDVVALHQSGFKTAVAPMGTALTEDQMRHLWRRCPSPILCFDGDSAGKRAAERAANRCLPLVNASQTLSFVFLPEGEDPDSLLRQGGRSTLENLLRTPLPLIDMLWRIYLTDRSFNTPEQKSKSRKDVYHLCDGLSDPDIKHFYIEEFLTRLRPILYSPKQKDIFGGIKNYSPLEKTKALPPVLSSNTRTLIAQKTLLLTLINHPKLLEDFLEPLMSLEVADNDIALIREKIVEICMDHPYMNDNSVMNVLTNAGLHKIIESWLTSQLYAYAPFTHPETPLDKAREGWENVWSSLVTAEQLTDETNEAIAHARSTFDQSAWERLKRLKSAQCKNV